MSLGSSITIGDSRMDRKKAIALLPIIQAFADGKAIQYRVKTNGAWTETEDLTFNRDPSFYRIKPILTWRKATENDAIRAIRYGASPCRVWNAADGEKVTEESKIDAELLGFFEGNWVARVVGKVGFELFSRCEVIVDSKRVKS